MAQKKQEDKELEKTVLTTKREGECASGREPKRIKVQDQACLFPQAWHSTHALSHMSP